MNSKRSDILEKIKKTCVIAGRDPKEIKLVAVSKKQSQAKISLMFKEGQRVFAENYIQEFLEKYENLPREIEWHLIGPLQKNKINKILGKIELIHSVDSLEMAKAISQRTRSKQKILLQTNIAEEDSKSGLSVSKLMASAAQIASLPNIEVCGLMTMPPFTESAENSRPYFKKLALLKKELQKTIPTMRELSMGTTQDYVVAIEEGATLVRIGEAIFGPRD